MAFNHQPRNGKRKRPKQRKRQGLGIGGDPERLLVHREMEMLRAAAERPRPGRAAKLAERARKLAEARRAAERTQPTNQEGEQ